MKWIFIFWSWLSGDPQAAVAAEQMQAHTQSVQVGVNEEGGSNTYRIQNTGELGTMMVRDMTALRRHVVVIFEDTHFTKPKRNN